MATSMNRNFQETKSSSVGLLLIIGEIISNEQRDEICSDLRQAFHRIDNHKYHELGDLFNSLINTNDFQTDCQYRQIVDTPNGSVAGFVYLPNYYALLNILKDLFNSCYHVSIIYCGQQIDSNGALILSDSTFSCEDLLVLFKDHSSHLIRDLELFLPLVISPWTTLAKNTLEKKLHHIQIYELSHSTTHDYCFGEIFYNKFVQLLKDDSANFDIYSKLIPRDSSGTIAFDEPNLYALYGQHGEASLFGIRGFLVLINSGFSRLPSYWNLIRGLQTIDACILTHFDYDTLPGLQTIVHRKIVSLNDHKQSCKPEIGAIFINSTQQAKLQSEPCSKSSLNRKCLISLNENINEFLNDIKQLNINTFDLANQTMSPRSTVEPLNLYKKIAHGSLDLYILHPTKSITEDERTVINLQRIPIRDQQPSSSTIPTHHWYSSCLLLVWTSSVKSTKDSFIRVLYPGACPQTLVFEALNRVRHLDFLHGAKQQQQQQKKNIQTKKITTTTLPPHTNINAKRAGQFQKTKISLPIPDHVAMSTQTPKFIVRSTISQPKILQNKVLKSEKSRAVPAMTKVTKATAVRSVRFSNKNKVHKIPGSTTKVSIQGHERKDDAQVHKIDKSKKSQEIQENISFQDEINEDFRQKASSDIEFNHNNPVLTNNTREDRVQQPELIPLTTDNDELGIESCTSSSVNEVSSELLSEDQPLTDNVLVSTTTENIDYNNQDDGDFDLIRHDPSVKDDKEMISTDNIHPQGLPVDDNVHSIEPTVKRLSNTTNKINEKTKKNLHMNSNQSLAPNLIFNVDVAYIPYHGNEHYVDKEFFRRIRARYYILNAVQISRLTLESLIDGKQLWENKINEPVNLVPTFDSEQLRQFFVMNKSRLAELNINILSPSNRCNVQYDDEGSPAQILRFN